MRYRNELPQLSGNLFLTDGGLETTLVFIDGIDLPEFAAITLLDTHEGNEQLRNYYHKYLSIARDNDVGFVLESATWRSNPDWADRLGYSSKKLHELNRKAIELLFDIREQHEDGETRIVISGCIGPRGDGYNPRDLMNVTEAEQYHLKQIEVFHDAGADMVTGITINYEEEAVGIVRAAASTDIPVAISFTVETDGKLPTGQSLREAIEKIDDQTSGATAYYMINCAHPTHFEHILDEDGAWLDRIYGLRANASRKSHAELDEAVELDDGDPVELGNQYTALKKKLKNLSVLGGCCGTDHRHVDEIYRACAPLF